MFSRGEEREMFSKSKRKEVGRKMRGAQKMILVFYSSIFEQFRDSILSCKMNNAVCE